MELSVDLVLKILRIIMSVLVFIVCFGTFNSDHAKYLVWVVNVLDMVLAASIFLTDFPMFAGIDFLQRMFDFVASSKNKGFVLFAMGALTCRDKDLGSWSVFAIVVGVSMITLGLVHIGLSIKHRNDKQQHSAIPTSENNETPHEALLA